MPAPHTKGAMSPDLRRAIHAFVSEAPHAAEAWDDAEAMMVIGIELGQLVRKTIRDANGRSNLDQFYTSRGRDGWPAGTERKCDTAPSDVVDAFCDALGFKAEIIRAAAVQEIENGYPFDAARQQIEQLSAA